MIQEVLVRAKIDEISLPIPSDKIERYVQAVINRYVEQYNTPISEDILEILARIAKDRNLNSFTQEEISQLAELFEHHFVLSYRNGERWFDLHPLVRRTTKLQNELRKGKESIVQL
jgi:hypothetical protein